MVQQVITLCDICYDEGASTSAQQQRLTINAAEWVLELCEAHEAELIAPLQAAAERVGERIKSRPAAASSGWHSTSRPLAEPCLICGVVTTSTASLAQHARLKHGMSGLGGLYGLACPLCAKVGASSSATGMHISKAHPETGLAGIPEAFRYAHEHGDPHGVVAKRLAELGTTMPPRQS